MPSEKFQTAFFIRTGFAASWSCFRRRFSYPIKKLPPFFQRYIAPSRFGIGFGFPAACRTMPF